MKKLILVLISLSVIMLFQNCSNAGFNSEGTSTSLSSVGGNPTGEALRVTRAEVDGSNNQLVELVVDTSRLGPLVSILWDHVFADDLVFCQQTSDFELRTAAFLCPSKGMLKVSVLVTLLSGETYTESLEIDLDGTGGSGPGNPEPELTGAQLYTTYCIGCHGGLATSTKRGMTLSRFNSSLNSVSQMAALRTVFTAEQKQKIVDALK